jgi:uncharacterized protein YndB with AHSA1/START domain
MDLLPWIGMALLVFGVVVAVIAVSGARMPRTHAVFRTLESKQPPEAVWAVVTDFAGTPSWHADVTKVERLPGRNGHEVWRETYRGGYGLRLETLEATPARRLVRSIVDEKGPFKGRWEFDLEPLPTGTRVTLTEYGEIANPFFRFMARVFMNPAFYIEQYLQALAVKLGDAAPAPAPPGTPAPRA